MISKSNPLIETKDLVKKFGSFTALNGVSLKVYPGEVHALLGDNGAGKSTLIKALSGVHQPTSGKILVEGNETKFNSPRDASEVGIGTVYQDLALNSLTSVTRNFFLGRELKFGKGPFGILKMQKMHNIAIEEMAKIGIGIGIIAPWVAARELEEGSLKIIEAEGLEIKREWGVFHSASHQPSLLEETFIGLTRMAFDLLPSY